MEASAHCEEGRHGSDSSLELHQRLDPSELSMEELCLDTREGPWMSTSTVFSSFSLRNAWSPHHDPGFEDSPRSIDQRLDSDEDLGEDYTGDTYSDQLLDHSVVSDKSPSALNEPRREASPVPSYLSARTNQSKEPPLNFTDSHLSVKHRIKKRRAPPVSSYESLRSNQYMSPPRFLEHGLSIDQMVPKKRLCSEFGERSKHQHSGNKSCSSHNKSKEKTRREASFPSCVSLKSNHSNHPLLNFKDGQHSPHPTSRDNEKRQHTLRNEKRSRAFPVSSVRKKETRGEASSFVSLRSNQSRDQPLAFKDGRHSLHPTSRGKGKRKRSVITDQMYATDFPDQSALVDHQHLDVVFKLLEKNVVTFVRNQLKVFHRTLTQTADSVGELGNDEKVLNEEKTEQRRISSEASLKIAVQFLKEMKHEQLADDLHKRLVGHICHRKIRSNLKKKFQCLFEGIAKAGNPTLLNQIYTELFVTEGGTGGVNDEHEVRQIEKVSRSTDRPEKTVRYQDIFSHTPERDQPVRMLLTKGVAGIGKTILTQKFTLDWAEGKTYHDIQFTFPFTFRELNLIKDKRFSLVELVHHFFAETKEAGLYSFKDYQVVFIFDGLDECRLPLDFHNNDILTDVSESTSVDVLLTNLIKGNLLPSARLWITTRPAAANQIPPECVDMVTEVRGFTDKQKEEYFRKRFKDEKQASSIISHIKTSRSLHIMCHIPVFCWITATVLEDVLKTREGGDLPKTLTELYIHFLVVQSKVKNVKYYGGAGTDPHWSPDSRKMMESLGKLAFEQLQKGNLIFYESDLTECGIDIKAASVYSGVFTQIFKEERGLYQDKVFCFVHLSVQEFLAALYVHLMFINSGVNLLEANTAHVKSDLQRLHQSAVNKALQSPNGHLDLFLRFLLGLSLKGNHILLRGLTTEAGGKPQSNQETVEFIKKKTGQNPSSERNINLFYCLNELNDHSLEKEIQQYLHSGNLINQELSPAQWSALVFILLSSRQDLDVFELKRYCCSELGLLRMLPVVKASKKAVLSSCNLSVQACEVLASVLTCTSSNLIELDLSYNKPQDSGVKKLSVALESSDCRLETLRLCGCELTSTSYQALASALSSQSSSLRKLDLSGNHLFCSDVKQLCDGLTSPCCKLEILGLRQTSFSKTCSNMLSSVLNSHPSSLRELDLSDNDLKDSGVELISAGLKSPHCKLKTLRLSGCLITEKGCHFLAFALKANPLHLRQLDLRYNHPGDSGRKLFSAKLQNPQSRLKKPWFHPCGEQWLKPGLNKYTRGLTLNLNTAHKNLKLSEDCRSVTLVQEDQLYSDNPDRFDCCQLLCEQGLTGRCYWEVEWKGLADIAVTYKGIRRRGNSADCRFGGNDKSWSLYCSDGGYSVWHNNRETVIHPPSSSAFTRVAVYLDWDAGTLSFYGFYSRKRILLHTFSCKFTEPLIPGFGVGSSVCLCEPEFFRKSQ